LNFKSSQYRIAGRVGIGELFSSSQEIGPLTLVK
jgi:hypothetical protein